LQIHLPGTGVQGHAVALSVVPLHRLQQAEVACGLAEDGGVILRLVDLLFKLGHRFAVAVGPGLGGELRVHGGVLVGFALDRQLQAAGQHLLLLLVGEDGGIGDHQLRVQQPEMGEGVLGLLGGGVAEQFGQLGVAELLGHVGEEEVFAVGHALAAEGGLEVGVGSWLGEVHGKEANRSPSYTYS
jgi:hypothetical protein